MTEDSNALAPSPSVATIKAVITQFLQERLEPRLKKLKPDDIEGREKLLSDNKAENWIPNAATRVEKITQVTHAIKYSHPDAKGSSLLSYGNTSIDELLIGTQSLKGKISIDIVCDAKQLDVYKFLSLPVGDKTLMDLITENHQAVAAALSPDPELANSWMAIFAAWANHQNHASPEKIASHSLAKQIYWPLSDKTYHLLAPLFPTSLAHATWEAIRRDRSAEGDDNAKRSSYRTYPDLAVQHFGGDSGKQNISQLNVKRHGENYLLPALPPNWQPPAIRPPFSVNSIFDRIFSKRPKVKELTDSLRDFLKFQERKKIAILLRQSPPKCRDEPISERLSRIPNEVLVSAEQQVNNQGIRATRRDLTQSICDEALLYAAELHDAVDSGELTAGWTQHEDCQLNRAEQLWLDPLRRHSDPDFARDHESGEWPDEICRRFGKWLNDRLTTKILPMSAVEAEHWRGELEKEMRLLRRELADHE